MENIQTFQSLHIHFCVSGSSTEFSSKYHLSIFYLFLSLERMHKFLDLKLLTKCKITNNLLQPAFKRFKYPYMQKSLLYRDLSFKLKLMKHKKKNNYRFLLTSFLSHHATISFAKSCPPSTPFMNIFICFEFRLLKTFNQKQDYLFIAS